MLHTISVELVPSRKQKEKKHVAYTANGNYTYEPCKDIINIQMETRKRKIEEKSTYERIGEHRNGNSETVQRYRRMKRRKKTADLYICGVSMCRLYHIGLGEDDLCPVHNIYSFASSPKNEFESIRENCAHIHIHTHAARHSDKALNRTPGGWSSSSSTISYMTEINSMCDVFWECICGHFLGRRKLCIEVFFLPIIFFPWISPSVQDTHTRLVYVDRCSPKMLLKYRRNTLKLTRLMVSNAAKNERTNDIFKVIFLFVALMLTPFGCNSPLSFVRPCLRYMTLIVSLPAQRQAKNLYTMEITAFGRK